MIEENRKIYLKKIDIRLKFLAIARLCFSLDLIQNRIYDASHFKWKNLRKFLYNFLVINMLLKKKSIQYLKAFQFFSYALEWSRIQNLMYYIEFWSLSKTKRAFILLSLILRCNATIEWFRLSYLQAMNKIMIVDTFFLKINIKTLNFITTSKSLHIIIVKTRTIYQKLIKCDITFEKIFSIDNVTIEINDMKDNFNENSIINIFENEKSNVDLKNNFMTKILSIATNSNFELEFLDIFAIETIVASREKKIQKDHKSKVNKFENFLALFNVHVELHFVENAREYAIVMNSNVLVKNFKHMSFLKKKTQYKLLLTIF